MKETLSEYFRNCASNGIIDHSIRANVDSSGDVQIYIHPDGKDGNTLDFKVSGNELTQI